MSYYETIQDGNAGMGHKDDLNDAEYAALAEFRYALRQFLAFSERGSSELGLTPQQHQALLAIRGASKVAVNVGYVAERLSLKPHSATGLINRLQGVGLITRHPSPEDGRQALLRLTPKARALLRKLSETNRDEIVRIRPLLNELLKQID